MKREMLFLPAQAAEMTRINNLFRFKRFRLFFILIFLAITGFTGLNAQQEPTDIKYTVSFTIKILPEALEELKNLTGIEFSYNSDIIPKNFTVNKNFKEKNIEEILNEILKGTNLTYKVIDKSIIIYVPKHPQKKEDSAVVIPDAEVQPLPEERIKITEVYDTIITHLHDTIINIVYDTVKVVEREKVTIYDTVEYRIEKPGKSSINWLVEIYGSPLLSRYIIAPKNREYVAYSEEYKSAVSSPVSYGFGIDLGMKLKKYSFFTGISYYNYLESLSVHKDYFDYFTNSYYKDTSYWVEKIDTITDYRVDNSPFYVETDDSYMKEDSVEVFYKDSSSNQLGLNHKNNYSYIEIPVGLGYTYSINNKLNITLKGSLNTGFLIGAKGKTFNSDTTINDVSTKNLMKINFAVCLAPGISYRVNKNIELFFDLYYKKTLKSMYVASYPLRIKPEYYGLALGARLVF